MAVPAGMSAAAASQVNHGSKTTETKTAARQCQAAGRRGRRACLPVAGHGDSRLDGHARGWQASASESPDWQGCWQNHPQECGWADKDWRYLNAP